MENSDGLHSSWQLFAFGSAIFAAATTILGKLGVAEINSNLATLIRTVVVVAATACLVTVRSEWEPVSKLSRFGLLMLLLSGLATGASWLCYYRALQLAPASRVAPIDKLSVAIVLVFAIAFLGEPLSWRVVVGGLLIVIGVALLAAL